MAVTQRILHPAWRDEYEATPYPFGDWAELRNDGGVFIPEGTFLDAAIYPIGSGPRLRLSKVVVSRQEAKLYIGDDDDAELISGELDMLARIDDVRLVDKYDRPAGLLVSSAERLLIFQTWPLGTHTFTFAQTGFSAHACLPIQANYFLGFVLDDGSVLAGDVWLIGDDGIVLSQETVETPQDDCQVALGLDPTEQRIRVDIVGDPLFRQRLCANNTTTPRFLQQLTFGRGCDKMIVGPNPQGSVAMTAGRLDGESTILRIRNVGGALRIDTVGNTTEGNH